MDVIITVEYRCTLEHQDARDIENGTMELNELDWGYYVDNYSEAQMIDVYED